MIVQVQGSIRCGTCSESFPLNAAVSSLPCDRCGARVDLQDALWQGVLEEAIARVEPLEPNGAVTARYTQHETVLQLQLARKAPRCPHCEAAWPDEVSPGFSCPDCGEEIPVRPPPVAVEGLSFLVAEDRALLEGRRAERRTTTLGCDACGAPLTADGSARKLTCTACGVEQVLSDEIWRRVHAPTRVSPWYLQVRGAGRAAGLGDSLTVWALAVDPQRRLYISGSYGDTSYALLGVDLDPVRLAWMVDVEALRPEAPPQIVVAPRGRLALYDQANDRIDWIDAETGAHLGEVRAPGPVLTVAAQVDGTFVACQHPEHKLIRFDVDGREVPLWPPAGLLGRLFGGGPTPPGSPPVARMNTLWHGAIGLGWDGDLRIVVPGHVGRLGRDGTLVWSTEIEALSVPAQGCSPGAAKDGTTYAVGFASETLTATLYRIDPDGSGTTPIATVRSGTIGALAVMASGEVCIAVGDELRHLDRDGNLLWRKGSGS